MQLSSEPGVARVLHVGVGALVMAAGVIGASLSIPDDITPPGALTFASYLLAISLAAPLLPSMRNDTRSLLRGENVLIAALVYWTLSELLQGRYAADLSRDAVVREFFMIGTAGIGFWLGANAWRPMAPKFLFREAMQPLGVPAIFAVLVLAFVLGIWDFFYRADFDLDTMVMALGNDRWNTPWQRESLGDWSAFSYHLQYFGYLVPPLTVLLALRAGARRTVTWIGLCMSVTILAFHAQGGGRRIVGAMILAGLFCWLIDTRRLTFLRALATLVAVGALVALLQVMLVYRGVGFGDSSGVLPEFDYVFVDDNFLRIGQMLEFVPETRPFVGWQYVTYALVRPIPRMLWPDKPIDGGFELAEELGIPDTSFALTMAGELYVSFGYIAVFLGALVYGRFATMVNALFEKPPGAVNPLFPSLMLVWLFVGVRSMLEIMLMGYVLLAMTLLSAMVRHVASLRRGASLSQPPGTSRTS